jgi:hypothetical protein
MPASISLAVLALLVPSALGQTGPTSSHPLTSSRVEGGVVLELFTDSACTAGLFLLPVWERRCTAFGTATSGTPNSASATYSVAQLQCSNAAGRSPTATVRVFRTGAATAGQCDTGAASFDLAATLANTNCLPVNNDLTLFYKTLAINCETASTGTLFNLRTYAAAGCSGDATLNTIHLGNCTERGFRGINDASLTPNASIPMAYNVQTWNPPANCSSTPATAPNVEYLGVTALQDDVPAANGCVNVGPGSVSLREARLFTPPGAGELPAQPLSSIAVAAIIIGALALILLVFYVLLKNNLLCRAAPVKTAPPLPRKDLTQGSVAASVTNPVGGAVVVPNALYGVGAIKEFK